MTPAGYRGRRAGGRVVGVDPSTAMLAVHEMVRVLRQGGRLCLTDTDWNTFTVDVPDRQLGTRFAEAVVASRREGADTGARLLGLMQDAGLVGLEHTDAVHTKTAWDPDTQRGPSGLFPLHDVLAVVTGLGALDDDEATRVLAHLEDAARADRFSLAVTVTAVCGRKS